MSFALNPPPARRVRQSRGGARRRRVNDHASRPPSSVRWTCCHAKCTLSALRMHRPAKCRIAVSYI